MCILCFVALEQACSQEFAGNASSHHLQISQKWIVHFWGQKWGFYRGGFKGVPQHSSLLYLIETGCLTVCGYPGSTAFLLKSVCIPPLKNSGSASGFYKGD